MKKRLMIVMISVLLAFVLGGCGCEHEWIEADCLSPRMCSLCQETDGEALGHSWIDASCTAPKTCVLCELKEGDMVPHIWVEADCDNAKTCSICKTTEGMPLGHKFGEWQESEPNIIDGTAVMKKTCEVCNLTTKEEQKLDSLVKDGCFLFDAETFSNRLCIALEESCSEEGEEIYTAEYDYRFTDVGFSCCVTVYDEKGNKIALIFPNGAYSSIDLTYLDVDILTDGLLPSALVYRSVIMACDSQLTYGDATNIGKKLLTQCLRGMGEYSENGILYQMKHSDFDGFLFWVKIEET